MDKMDMALDDITKAKPKGPKKTPTKKATPSKKGTPSGSKKGTSKKRATVSNSRTYPCTVGADLQVVRPDVTPALNGRRR
jgi:hypothetical protein